MESESKNQLSENEKNKKRLQRELSNLLRFCSIIKPKFKGEFQIEVNDNACLFKDRQGNKIAHFKYKQIKSIKHHSGFMAVTTIVISLENNETIKLKVDGNITASHIKKILISLKSF